MIIRITSYSKKLYFFTIILSVFINRIAIAQNSDKWIGGFNVGGNYSKIENLDQTILSEPFFLNYSLETKTKIGLNVGGYLNYRGFLNNLFGVRLEAAYSQQGSELRFNDTQTHFNYKIRFKYQYINFNLFVKGYLGDIEDSQSWTFLSKLNFYTGLSIGANSTPSNIFYTSNANEINPLFGSDLAQQQQLRIVLKGKTNIAIVFGLGYETSNLTFDLRYYWGRTDVVETQANSYSFIENQNKMKFWQFSAGYHMPLNW